MTDFEVVVNEDEEMPEMQATKEEVKREKRHIVSAFYRDSEEDMEWVRRYERLVNITNIAPKDIFIEGLRVCLKSEAYQKACKEMQDDALLIEE